MIKYETSCASDHVQVICHGIPDKRPLEDGDIVNVDVSAYYRGYHGDLNETFVVGQVDATSKRLIKAAHDVSCHPGPHLLLLHLQSVANVIFLVFAYFAMPASCSLYFFIHAYVC